MIGGTEGEKVLAGSERTLQKDFCCWLYRDAAPGDVDTDSHEEKFKALGDHRRADI
jgi:hypothetical protein